MSIKIISYNVNGIRAALRKGLAEWLAVTSPDILCLQEIKATEDQIDQEKFRQLGYAYQYWYPAQRKGYSGTAILSKIKPQHIEKGTGIDFMDMEGRNIRADFEGFSVMSLYLPSGTNDERLQIKFRFMDHFYNYISDLKKHIPGLIISGDYNICHQPRDIHDPIRLQHVSGFLPEERAWLSAFMDLGFTDTFRMFDPSPHQYSWWSYRAGARQRNKGWRIDYHLTGKSLDNKIERSLILKDAVHSDHAPILLEIKE